LTTAPPQPPPPVTNVINDEEVRNFVTSFYHAQERGDIDYMLSQYADSFKWGPERVDRAARRNEFTEFIKRWPILSFSLGDIRVVHSEIPDRVTLSFDERFFYRNPASGRSDSGHATNEWTIYKTPNALKIISRKRSVHHDAATPSTTPARGSWLFPDSSSRYLSATELSNLNSDDLWRARNEIFARRGLKFTSQRGTDLVRSLGND